MSDETELRLEIEDAELHLVRVLELANRIASKRDRLILALAALEGAADRRLSGVRLKSVRQDRV